MDALIARDRHLRGAAGIDLDGDRCQLSTSAGRQGVHTFSPLRWQLTHGH